MRTRDVVVLTYKSVMWDIHLLPTIPGLLQIGGASRPALPKVFLLLEAVEMLIVRGKLVP